MQSQHRTSVPPRKTSRLSLSFLLLLIIGGNSIQLAYSTNCPSSDPTENYNCSLGPTYLLPGWGDSAGWNEAQYYSTIQHGDIDGDGADELIGRYADGIHVNKFDTDTGQWLPIGSPGLLSDPSGWNEPQYYLTIQLGDIDGDEADELLARSSAGIVTYRWSNNSQEWKPVGLQNEPALSDHEGWGQPRYYSTIQLGDIDGDGIDEMLARSRSGILTYKWNQVEEQWKAFGRQRYPALSDRNGWYKPQYYSTIQLGDIDGDGSDELLARAAVGMVTYKWEKTTKEWKQISIIGDPQLTDSEHYNEPEYYSTIQLADICCTEQKELLVRSPSGLIAYVWDGSQWLTILESSLFSDADGWNHPEYYSTIQFADIDGDGSNEVIARASTGILAYKFDISKRRWNPIGTPGEPALSDNVWNQASRYFTLQSADVNGDHVAELLGRGQFGIRTWFFDRSVETWNRYMPYGFSVFSGGKKAALALLNEVIGLDGTTIRETYGTDTTILLTKSQACIFADEKSAATTCQPGGNTVSPPTVDCKGNPLTVPADITPADWTEIACSIYYELENATLVADHFNELSSIVNTLFIQENSTQDAIIEDLKLDSSKEADGDFSSLFANVVKLAGSIAAPFSPEIGIPLTVAGNAISVAAAATPSASSRFSDKTLSTVLNEISSFQTQLPASSVRHRKYISGDSGLLNMVGQLVQGRWRDMDEIGILSTSRLGFAKWLYQAFLPSMWDKWQITDCGSTAFLRCGPPSNGRYMSYYRKTRTYTEFTGLLPKQTPCKSDGPPDGRLTVVSCGWEPPASDLVDKVWGDITEDCQYNGSNSGWDYANCNVGIGNQAFDWPFEKRKGSPVVVSPDVFAPYIKTSFPPNPNPSRR